MASIVAVIQTRPATVLDDYRRVMHLADYQIVLRNALIDVYHAGAEKSRSPAR